MAAMGGRANWDATRYITWRFFGFRLHVWDRWTGDIRFEQDDLTVLMNIHTREGRAFAAGVEISDPDTLAAKLDHGYRAWINDSYWLVMPYKLKDTGVTLRYRGLEATEDGRPGRGGGADLQGRGRHAAEQVRRLDRPGVTAGDPVGLLPGGGRRRAALHRPLDQLGAPRIDPALRRPRRARAHGCGGTRGVAGGGLYESRPRGFAPASGVSGTSPVGNGPLVNLLACRRPGLPPPHRRDAPDSLSRSGAS